VLETENAYLPGLIHHPHILSEEVLFFIYLVFTINKNNIKLSFGNSVKDILLLLDIARKTYYNCKEAGDEYLEVAHVIRSLRSVLEIVCAEAKDPQS